jgi:pimeloyl-ACP methyl ester carboxylesterase
MNSAIHSRFFNLPSGRLHLRDCGEGPAVMLLHANPGDSRDFDAVVPVLSQSHRVLAVDWPGYGLSEMPQRPHEVDALFFYQVLQQLVELIDLPPMCLVGNSLGGYAATRLAVTDPHRVAGLILVSPGGFTRHNAVTRAFCRWQGSRWAMSPARWASIYLKRNTDTTRAMKQRAAKEQSSSAQKALNRSLWRSFADDSADLSGLAQGVSAPALLLFGRHDPAIPAHRDGRVAAASMPHAQSHVLDCGHAAFAEAPHVFLSKVQPFLSTLWPQEVRSQWSVMPERKRLR